MINKIHILLIKNYKHLFNHIVNKNILIYVLFKLSNHTINIKELIFSAYATFESQ